MRLDLSPVFVVVTLSERNLASLQYKLQNRDVGNALVSGEVYRDGAPVDGPMLVVRIEFDDEHYARRPDPPGGMHPLTEAFIAGKAAAAAELRTDPAADAHAAEREVAS